MKLIHLLPTVALAAFTAATFSPINNGDFIDRATQPGPSADECDVCMSDLASCYLKCPQRDQKCASRCKPTICTSGRPQCRKGGKCTDFTSNCKVVAEVKNNVLARNGLGDVCEPCFEFFRSCMDDRPEKEDLDCPDICMAETCKNM